MWHDSFTSVGIKWHIHVWDKTHVHVWHVSSMCVTGSMYICDMTHLYMSTNSCSPCADTLSSTVICVTWLIYICDKTHSCVRHDSFTCVTSLMCVCDTAHLHVRHDSLICVIGRIYTCDMSHSYLSTNAYNPLPKMRCRALWQRGRGLGSSTIFKKFNEPYAPS